jgi:predicted MPP superfamily phosphohydrolase
MSLLEAKHGVFACLGNHDIFTRSEEALARRFTSAGFKLLRNRNEIIDIGGAELNVIGMDFLFASRSTASTLDHVLSEMGPPIRINAPPEITHITLRAG